MTEQVRNLIEQLDRKVTPNVITRVFRSNVGRVPHSYEEHRAIADAVLRGDAALAARLIEEHLEYGRRHLLPRAGGPGTG